MRRDVTTRMTLEAMGPARIAVAIAAVGRTGVEDRFEARLDGTPIAAHAVDDAHGGRLHILEVTAGTISVDYSASVLGLREAPLLEPIDELRYLRPSRYCESDSLRSVAVAEFGELRGAELLVAVSSWVGVNVAYVAGSSLPTDGAVRTFLSRRGVCRDFAHLVVGFLRALDVPARVASVYAPGLSPMDFHAVAEAAVDGAWHVVDATARAPRGSLLRIATGRDAADTAFLAVRGDEVVLNELEVSAVADALPDDDLHQLAVLR